MTSTVNYHLMERQHLPCCSLWTRITSVCGCTINHFIRLGPRFPHIKLRARSHRLLRATHIHLHRITEEVLSLPLRARKMKKKNPNLSCVGFRTDWEIKNQKNKLFGHVQYFKQQPTSPAAPHRCTHQHLAPVFPVRPLTQNHMRKSSPPTAISTSVAHRTHSTCSHVAAMNHSHTSALPFISETLLVESYRLVQMASRSGRKSNWIS